MILVMLPFVSVVKGIINILNFFFKRLSLFEINFAGGRIAFDVRWYPEVDSKDFQRQLRLMKDQMTEKVQTPQEANSAANASAAGSTADELKKWADLLSQGIITQEDFNEIKQKLLLSYSKGN